MIHHPVLVASASQPVSEQAAVERRSPPRAGTAGQKSRTDEDVHPTEVALRTVDVLVRRRNRFPPGDDLARSPDNWAGGGLDFDPLLGGGRRGQTRLPVFTCDSFRV